jgi:membrane protein implicated in regulation of membrane protease activity
MGWFDFLMAHPALAWLGGASLLLAVEVATGTGWLLWAAGAAGAVCVVLLLAPLGLAWQLALFAVLTIVSSLLGRRLLPPGAAPGGDINDVAIRLIGRKARVVAAFQRGRGRVTIDGKEWSAVLVSGADPAEEDLVEVIAASGAELSVAAN